MNKGKIVQVIGPVVDVEFEKELPQIYNALEVRGEDRGAVLEVAGHLGGLRIRSVSMTPTEGLCRGLEVVDTGAPIKVPVGEQILGRLFNLLGQPVDEGKPLSKPDDYWAIHRKAPLFSEQSTKKEVFETGIKVIDLVAPFIKCGK